VLQNALRIEPNSREVLQTLSRVYALKKNPVAAEEQLRKIVELYPKEPTAWADLGDFLATTNKTAETREVYKTIIQRDPQNPLGYLKLSGLYRFENKYQEALAALEEGYRQNQVSIELLSELVKGYLQQKRHAAAIAVC
jgi:predicted Zn-dependent protease